VRRSPRQLAAIAAVFALGAAAAFGVVACGEDDDADDEPAPEVTPATTEPETTTTTTEPETTTTTTDDSGGTEAPVVPDEGHEGGGPDPGTEEAENAEEQGGGSGGGGSGGGAGGSGGTSPVNQFEEFCEQNPEACG
jgi:hypothetical protein